MRKSRFSILLYLSFAFLAIALYKADYLVVPRIYSPWALAGSFLFLFIGFICDPLSWKALLDKSNQPVRLRESLAAVGLSVFAKYIPGKIWAVVGRAGYLVARRAYPIATVASISVLWQVICLWLGTMFGAVGLLQLGKILVWGWPILILWIGMTTVIFSGAAQSVARGVYRKVFHKDIDLPRLSAGTTLRALPWFVIMWVALSVGFQLLVTALSPTSVPMGVGPGFPLTITLGVFAVFAPGGLGVREGLMVGYLALAGIPAEQATAISIAARLWFLLGEAFMFVVGLIANSGLDLRAKNGNTA